MFTSSDSTTRGCVSQGSDCRQTTAIALRAHPSKRCCRQVRCDRYTFQRRPSMHIGKVASRAASSQPFPNARMASGFSIVGGMPTSSSFVSRQIAARRICSTGLRQRINDIDLFQRSDRAEFSPDQPADAVAPLVSIEPGIPNALQWRSCRSGCDFFCRRGACGSGQSLPVLSAVRIRAALRRHPDTMPARAPAA